MISASDLMNPNQNNNSERRYFIYDKIMISAMICLLLVALVVFMLYVYARYVSRQPARSFIPARPRSASRVPRFYFTGEEPERMWNVGLDSVILETLPMFVYKSQNFTDGLECAVCLCEFEENEKGRLLPNCRHSFHVECIDMWFRSHSTCPVCRTGAQPEQSVLEPLQVSVTISAPIASSFQDNMNSQQEQNMNSQQEQSASCGEGNNLQKSTSIFSWGAQKFKKTEMDEKFKKTEMDEGTVNERPVMSQIAIEIPKRPDGGFLSPGEGHQSGSPSSSQWSSKSPVMPLRSLTRMVSRDRDRTQVFPSDHPSENNEA